MDILILKELLYVIALNNKTLLAPGTFVISLQTPPPVHDSIVEIVNPFSINFETTFLKFFINSPLNK